MRFHPTIALVFFLLYGSSPKAQEKKVSIKMFEGTIVAGYVDKGVYLNCVGPSVKYNGSSYNVQLGLLPSIKMKDDPSPIKNSFFTPSLGFGATITLFGHLAIQIPAFYIPKTTTTNGKWSLGVGVGYKI